jgi:hypothetical protein
MEASELLQTSNTPIIGRHQQQIGLDRPSSAI